VTQWAEQRALPCVSLPRLAAVWRGAWPCRWGELDLVGSAKRVRPAAGGGSRGRRRCRCDGLGLALVRASEPALARAWACWLRPNPSGDPGEPLEVGCSQAGRRESAICHRWRCAGGRVRAVKYLCAARRQWLPVSTDQSRLEHFAGGGKSGHTANEVLGHGARHRLRR